MARADTSSPSITTVTYANNLGQVEKQGSVHNGTEQLDTYLYDYIGNKTQEKSARAYAEGWSQAYTAKYDYNYAGKPIKVYNVKGDYTTTQYDALGRTKKITDILGNKSATPYSTTFTYDNLGRVIKEEIPFRIQAAQSIKQSKNTTTTETAISPWKKSAVISPNRLPLMTRQGMNTTAATSSLKL